MTWTLRAVGPDGADVAGGEWVAWRSATSSDARPPDVLYWEAEHDETGLRVSWPGDEFRDVARLLREAAAWLEDPTPKAAGRPPGRDVSPATIVDAVRRVWTETGRRPTLEETLEAPELEAAYSDASALSRAIRPWRWEHVLTLARPR